MSFDIPVLLLVLLFSVIVHECAHGVAAEHFGDTTARRMGRLTLNPLSHIDPMGTIVVPLFLVLTKSPLLFGWAKPVPVNAGNLSDPARQYPYIAAAGPASNFLLATVSAIGLGIVVGLTGDPVIVRGSAPTLESFLSLLFFYGVQLNVLLALFNLIPLPPLDGSWILRRFLSGEAARMYDRIRPYGFFILIFLLLTGLRRFLGAAVGMVSGAFFSISDLIASVLS